MKPVTLHSGAEAEFEAAADFYEGRRAGLGEEFRAAVGDALGRIAATPTAFSPYQGGPARRTLIRRFSTGIYFVETNRAIYVVAIMDQRRQPDYWLDRLDDVPNSNGHD